MARGTREQIEILLVKFIKVRASLVRLPFYFVASSTELHVVCGLTYEVVFFAVSVFLYIHIRISAVAIMTTCSSLVMNAPLVDSVFNLVTTFTLGSYHRPLSKDDLYRCSAESENKEASFQFLQPEGFRR